MAAFFSVRGGKVTGNDEVLREIGYYPPPRRWAKPPLPWLLPLLAFILIGWQIPWLDIINYQAGMWTLLGAASAAAPATTQPDSLSLEVEPEALKQAARYLEQVDETTGNASRTLGVIDLVANDPVSAQQQLLHHLETAPDDTLARFFLGETYLRLGDISTTIKEWETAGASTPLMKLAQELIEQKKYPEALEALHATMRLNPVDLTSRWLAAEIWEEQKNQEQALALYQEIITIAPEDLSAREAAGKILNRQGKTELALALYQEMIEIEPLDEDGYLLSGEILFEQGQYEEAINFFKQALALDPGDSAKISLRLGQAHSALKQWPEAVAAYEQVIQKDPTQSQAYMLMGEAQCQLNHPAEAQFYYEQAIALGNSGDKVEKIVQYLIQHGNCPR